MCKSKRNLQPVEHREPLLSFHTVSLLESQIKNTNRIIYRFLRFFKDNKGHRHGQADLKMFSFYLKERNRFQRLFKKRLTQQNETPAS